MKKLLSEMTNAELRQYLSEHRNEEAIFSLVGWVERNNTGSKMAQFDCLSETQQPQRLLFVGFPCVNPTDNLIANSLPTQQLGR
jgi:hypothetical protein